MQRAFPAQRAFRVQRAFRAQRDLLWPEALPGTDGLLGAEALPVADGLTGSGWASQVRTAPPAPVALTEPTCRGCPVERWPRSLAL